MLTDVHGYHYKAFIIFSFISNVVMTSISSTMMSTSTAGSSFIVMSTSTASSSFIVMSKSAVGSSFIVMSKSVTGS